MIIRGSVVLTETPSRGAQVWLNGGGQSTARCLTTFAAAAGLAKVSAPSPAAAPNAAARVIAVRVRLALLIEFLMDYGRKTVSLTVDLTLRNDAVVAIRDFPTISAVFSGPLRDSDDD
jgi:hypothetical protein